MQKDGLRRSFLCFLRLSQKLILIGIIMGRYGTDPYFYGLEKTIAIENKWSLETVQKMTDLFLLNNRL